jgi:hypothetical protein
MRWSVLRGLISARSCKDARRSFLMVLVHKTRSLNVLVINVPVITALARAVPPRDDAIVGEIKLVSGNFFWEEEFLSRD